MNLLSVFTFHFLRIELRLCQEIDEDSEWVLPHFTTCLTNEIEIITIDDTFFCIRLCYDFVGLRKRTVILDITHLKRAEETLMTVRSIAFRL